MEHFYRGILPQVSKSIAETKKPYFLLKERHLQAAWLEQKYYRFLKTQDGREIKVISPGIWNLQSGPDFLKAHLIIDGHEVKGDIEIHFSSVDWFHHHHHQDPRYNNVILHIVLWKSPKQQDIITENKTLVAEVFLEDALTLSYERLAQCIDIDLYPYQIFAGSGKCAKHLFSLLKREDIQNFFRSAAAWRLVNKYEFFSTWIDNSSLFFCAGFAMGLGYKKNSESFRKLFLQLYPLKNVGEKKLLAIAMGMTGFFKSSWQNKWKGSEDYKYLYSLYLMYAMTHPIDNYIELDFYQVRPLNHPLRRLVVLIKLLCDNKASYYFEHCLDQWNHQWPILFKKNHWKELKINWLNLLPSYEDAYWNYYFLFEGKRQENKLSLVGIPLKQEIITNTIFPLLYHEIKKRGVEEELKAFFSFYGSFSASKTSKLKYLTYRFFGDSANKDLFSVVDLEQGAYQLHKDFCLHYEASCEGCPFIDNFNKTQNLN